jgi:uncharacterized protein (TIGR03085 family)
VTDVAAAERAALLSLMTDLGPGAATLCQGWTTHDLAAHLVVRERRPQALAGLVLPALRGLTARLEERERRTPYDQLLDLLRSGPPPWSLGGALRGPLAGATDVHEMYVHHEDVRRLVDPSPRPPVSGLDDALWRRLRVLAPAVAVRARGLGVTVATPQGRSLRLSRGGHEVVLHGTPRELFLWVFGRRAAAHVQVEGTPQARALASTAPLTW